MSAIIFDLDGTLVDSAPDIQAAANTMLGEEGREPLDLMTIISFIGNGLPKLVERVLRASRIDGAEFDRLYSRVAGIYGKNASVLTCPYEWVPETLAELKSQGFRLGVCTNKPEAPTLAILCDLSLDGLFDVVIGGDSTPARKPDPTPLLAAARALGGDAPLFVGDSEVDAETAVNAGVTFALFTEGYRKSPVTRIVHRYSFSDFRALPEFAAISALEHT